MSAFTEKAIGNPKKLRVVVDAQIVLAMFLTRRDRTGIISPKRSLIELMDKPAFSWLWTADIIADYLRGAEAIQADKRITARAEFDRLGFHLLLGALQLSAPVQISASTLRYARRRISEAPRAAERDLEDAVYLACAVDGGADLLISEDSDLRSLGSVYEGVRIVGWPELKDELFKRGFLVD